MLVGLLPSAVWAEVAVTPVSTAAELAALGGQQITGSYKLTADIDMTGQTMQPIKKFSSGTFDGQGHTISGLTITASSGNTGLFAETGSGAVIQGIVLQDANVSLSSGSYVGVGALGYFSTSSSNKVTLTNCYAACDVGGSASYRYPFAYIYSNYLTATNCLYESGRESNKDNTQSGITAASADELKAAAGTLGDAFRADLSAPINGGYPILRWQYVDPNATYTCRGCGYSGRR